MGAFITVREYARLSTEAEGPPTLDLARIPASAFAWLCDANPAFRAGGLPLVTVEGRYSLRLANYVGVIETSCGTRIEILPKVFGEASDAAASRRLLRRMINAAMDLRAREATEASLQVFDAPLSEWVLSQFLDAVSLLMKKGI